MSEEPRNLRRLFAGSLLAGALLLAVSVAFSTAMGAAGFGFAPSGFLPGAMSHTLVFELRLPRVLMAALLGGGLSLAGVVFQALLRNPLADPYILGVSGGASVGGVVALVLGLGSLAGGFGVPIVAFFGALGALLLIQWLGTVDGQLGVFVVLLTGAVFNAFTAALIYFIQSLASPEELRSIVFYLMGQVPTPSYALLGGFLVLELAAAILLLALARDYNALTFGETSATQLGVDVERVKKVTFVIGSLLTAVCVSAAGMIGFVGLVVPHLLRLVLGPDHRLLIPGTLLGGASFLVLADTLARSLASPSELPVGVVTALLGGPFFLVLLRGRGRQHDVVA